MAAKQTPLLVGRLVEHQSGFDPLGTDSAQWAIQHPKDAVALCVAAIRSRPKDGAKASLEPNHYRSLMESFTLPALARPTLSELAKYGIRDIIEDTSPEDEVRLDLGTVLLPGESLINGDTYTARVGPLKGLTLGFQHAIWIAENGDKVPAWLAALRGKVYIDFRGITVLDADGGRYFPYLSDVGGRWTLRWGWAGRSLSGSGRVAVSGK